MVEVFPELSHDLQFSERRAAQELVDAALLCRRELFGEEVSWEARQALIEGVRRDPLLTAELFMPLSRA